MNSTTLHIAKLKVYFDTFDGVSKVLEGVDIEVHETEVVCLVGETGCGKTVTAKTVLGSLPIPPGRIVNGSIYLLEDDLLGLSRKQRNRIISKKMSYIPQDSMGSLNPVFTVGQQMVDLICWQGRRRLGPLEFLGLRGNRRDALNVAITLLTRVKIPSPEEVVRRYPVELSGGMRQRVLIARALIGHPHLLIADEPTTALDVTIQRSILELIDEKVKEEALSVLYITHNLGVARRISQTSYVMYAGTIVEKAPTSDLLADPKHPYSAALIKSIPKLSGEEFSGIEGVIPDYIDPPDGCRFAPRCRYTVKACAQEKPLLTEIGENRSVACHLFSIGGEP